MLEHFWYLTPFLKHIFCCSYSLFNFYTTFSAICFGSAHADELPQLPQLCYSYLGLSLLITPRYFIFLQLMFHIFFLLSSSILLSNNFSLHFPLTQSYLNNDSNSNDSLRNISLFRLNQVRKHIFLILLFLFDAYSYTNQFISNTD